MNKFKVGDRVQYSLVNLNKYYSEWSCEDFILDGQQGVVTNIIDNIRVDVVLDRAATYGQGVHTDNLILLEDVEPKNFEPATETIKILLFNSPPNSGKDFAKDFLCSKEGVYGFEFKHTLFEITRAIYGVSEEEWNKYYTREGKDIPREILNGLSCRGALIDTSERVIKPSFSKAFFAQSVVKQIKQLAQKHPNAVVVVSDCGFNSEVEEICKNFPLENIWIVRIESDGCTFEGDSRNWVDTDAILDSHYITIHNDKTDHFRVILDDTFEYIMKN